jgi:hypothetical protein
MRVPNATAPLPVLHQSDALVAVWLTDEVGWKPIVVQLDKNQISAARMVDPLATKMRILPGTSGALQNQFELWCLEQSLNSSHQRFRGAVECPTTGVSHFGSSGIIHLGTYRESF